MDTGGCPVRPFNQRLTYKFGQPFWTEDDHFDIDLGGPKWKSGEA